MKTMIVIALFASVVIVWSVLSYFGKIPDLVLSLMDNNKDDILPRVFCHDKVCCYPGFL